MARWFLDSVASVCWLSQLQQWSLASLPLCGAYWTLHVVIGVAAQWSCLHSERPSSCNDFGDGPLVRWSLAAIASVWWLFLCCQWSLIALLTSSSCGGHGCVGGLVPGCSGSRAVFNGGAAICIVKCIYRLPMQLIRLVSGSCSKVSTHEHKLKGSIGKDIHNFGCIYTERFMIPGRFWMSLAGSLTNHNCGTKDSPASCDC